MGLQIIQIDAFTNKPYTGNPAAVCILPAPRDDVWMQAVAREMNLAETAFLLQDGNAYQLRWFTPAMEIELCGHATLASAHALWEQELLTLDAPAQFYTRSGLLTCVRCGDWITMDFPATPPSKTTPPAEIAAALGATPISVGRSVFDYLVELEDAATVRMLEPDLTRLGQISARGIIVTAPSDKPGYDFVSRFFAPQSGIPEDPVTGSAHCCLGPFWGERLGKDSLVGYQASARGGVVRVRLASDRVFLSGQAVTVLRGDLVTEK
ncbi:MAG: PhzF family phenazine biosynthesis protein [Oscillochloris sp.]|nr:PhzF family phenazine biosynthesis protein [Oscillochloris sp.]